MQFSMKCLRTILMRNRGEQMQKHGNTVVEGVAIGKVLRVCMDYEDRLKAYVSGNTEEELAKYQNAHSMASAELAELLSKREILTESEAAILEAHQMLMEDIVLEETVLSYIQEGCSATDAVLQATVDFKAMFDEIDDEYLRERQKDIIDVGNRLLRKLLGMKEFAVEGENIVLVAKDIEPSIMAGLSEHQVKAILLENGSRTSHTVIIAKAKGFVTMVGVAFAENEVLDGDEIIVDAMNQTVIIKPEQDVLREYKEKLEKQEEKQKYLMSRANLPAKTLDGKEVLVAANISNPKDMEKANEYGCQGVGLYRTEFLFMESEHLPSEEEQYKAYESVAKQAEGAMCVIRTLDIGGDKHSDCLQLEKEENPFLGFRAIRICLKEREMFKTQIRAILRAGLSGKVAIMMPMIVNLEEILEAKTIIEEAKEELRNENIAFAEDVPVGIMIETPAAVLMASVFAKYVDFFSIGTNDLVQYTLAVDRGNQKVSYLYDYFNPAVIHSIYQIVTSAHKEGIWVGMCGEMAGDKIALPFLLAVGMDELGMSASSAPMIKEQIRNLKSNACELDKLLAFSNGEEIRTYLESLL